MFDEFIHQFKASFGQGLPGAEAHNKMAMIGRKSTGGYDPEIIKLAKKSGVLVLIYPHQNEPHIVLMKRVAYPGVHSGQISFPGGKKEDSDPDIVFTALREAREEVGAIPDNIEILGQMTDLYIPPSNFLVHPVLGVTPERPDFIAEHSEVAEIIEVPLSHLQNPEIISEKEITVAGGFKFNAPYFDVFGHTVWGATAMMLSEFLVITQRK